MNHMPHIVQQLGAYGLTTALSYLALLAGTYALTQAGLAALPAYAVSLAFVYAAVFYSYARFVFKTGMTRGIICRFIAFLSVFWFVNNGFFWLLHSVAQIPYPVVIVLNLVVLGGVRFFIQRTWVFRVARIPQYATLSFDVELWHEGTWMQPYVGKNPDDGDFRASIAALLAILKSGGHHATFFVTALIVERYPDLVQEISSAGHEIGVHGVSHDRLHDVPDREQFRSELNTLYDTITRLTGHTPKGFRAPHFSLDNTTRWVLPILRDIGFVYDSSVFPVRTPEYGSGIAPTTPYRVSFDDVYKKDAHSPLLEVPVAVAEVGSLRIPAAGGIYFRLLPLRIFSELLRVIPGMPVLYFHPHELYGATPRIRGPFFKTILKYWGTRRALRKFERLCGMTRFTSLETLQKQLQ